MNFPSDTPRLPKWIFLAGDAALLATAWFVASSSPHPANGMPLVAIVVCVVFAGVLGAIPFVADYARKQDEALDNRQRALQALAATVAASAEQISIAATGLQGIAEAAQDNLGKTEKTAEQIQEKIAELESRLATVRKGDDESAARIESAAKKVAKATGDLDAAAAKAAAALESAVTSALTSVGAASERAARSLEEAVQKATAEARESLLALRQPAEVPPIPVSRIVEIRPAVVMSDPPFEEPAAPPADRPEPVREAAVPAPQADVPVAPPDVPAPETTQPAPAEEAPSRPAPRKRAPRKTAPVEKPPAAPAASDAPDPAPEQAAVPAEAPAAAAEPASTPEVVIEEPPSAPAPVAEAVVPAAPAPEAVAEAPAPTLRRKAPRRAAEPDPDQDLFLAPSEASSSPQEAAEPALSADGATRLVITAYIGIGNRLFIRGEGPGLSWEKGVPLTFVSIGKWRWETNDAAAPVRFKLYKNDETECTALGERSVNPGAQADFTASF